MKVVIVKSWNDTFQDKLNNALEAIEKSGEKLSKVERPVVSKMEVSIGKAKSLAIIYVDFNPRRTTINTILINE